MAHVAVERIAKAPGQPLPLLQDLEKKFETVRKRAFEIFEDRGRQIGHDLEDWIRAEHEVMGWPAAELAEDDGEYKLEMTLAGFDPKEVQVTAAPGEIVVHAEIKGEHKPDHPHIVWTEFGPNNITRRFTLPKPIDVGRTKATLEHGLLKVLAAKAPQPKEKPVLVQ